MKLINKLINELNRYSFFGKVLLISILLYSFTVPFGMMFRTFQEVDYILDSPIINFSVLPYVIIVFSLVNTRHIKINKLIIYLLILSLYLFFVTFLFSSNFQVDLRKHITFSSYMFLTLLLSNVRVRPSTIRLFFLVLSIGSLVSSLFTIIDLFGIVDIPFFNEKTARVSGFDAIWVSGPFPSRTNMGAFYSIILPISFLSYMYYKKKVYLISFLFNMMAILLTFNRGAPFAAAIIIFVFFYRRKYLNLKNILRFSLISTLFITVLFSFLEPEQKEGLKYKFLSTLHVIEKSDIHTESDNARIDILYQIVTKELVRNPIGYGFTEFYFLKQHQVLSVHSNFNFILYSAGILGVIWLLLFLYNLFKYTLSLEVDELIIIKYSLLSWALFSLTHVTFSTFLAWILLSFLFNVELKLNSLDEHLNCTE